MKKGIIRFTASLTALSALTGMTAFAAGKYSAADLRSLNDLLLGKTTTAEYNDVNSDGVLNVFDLVAMRQAMLSTGEFTESTVAPSEDNVKFIGRNIFKDGKTALIQSGAAVEFTVTGKSAEIQILGDGSEKNGETSRPRYAVIVDGEIVLDELLSVSEKSVELFKGTENRTATVKVIHLSEANNGAVCVGGITVDSDSPSPVVPTPEKDLLIEFIGDSITCAYGVEGKDQYENFKTSTENFMKSYAYLTAEKLGADYSAVCYSGYGIISGYTSSGDKNTDSLVPPLYDYCGPNKYKEVWDPSQRPADVVVINLGTNDSGYIDKDFEKRSPEYVEGYEDFLGAIRKKNPDAQIICTLGTMGCTDEYPLIEKAVANFKKATGDTKVTAYQSATQNTADGLGSDWHPSAVTHQNSAYVLADKICQALGIESDQYGIDVAADAKYSVVTDSSANMSDYFSDWDRSYHITTVKGGDSADSIAAHVSGIGLKKDGKYRLQFQFEAPEGVTVPLKVQTADGKTLIFDDEIKGKGTKSAYSAEFTASIAGDSEIVLTMGGIDNLRLSIYELKMVRIG